MMMLKFGNRPREDWRCFCCHVRTATIMLGIWHLTLHVVLLSIMSVALRQHDIFLKENNLPILPTPLSKIETSTPHALPSSPDVTAVKSSGFVDRSLLIKRTLSYEDLNNTLFITTCTFCITLLMVYGALRGKPKLLLPYLSLMVFEFCMSCLSALSYLCYLPDLHRVVDENPNLPLQPQLSQLTPRCLTFLILFTFTLAMIIKAYFIGCVLGCYRYLKSKNSPPPLHLFETDNAADGTIHLTRVNGSHLTVALEPEQGILPDYDTACKKYPTPPPSYTVAMETAKEPVRPLNLNH